MTEQEAVEQLTRESDKVNALLEEVRDALSRLAEQGDAWELALPEEFRDWRVRRLGIASLAVQIALKELEDISVGLVQLRDWADRRAREAQND